MNDDYIWLILEKRNLLQRNFWTLLGRNFGTFQQRLKVTSKRSQNGTSVKPPRNARGNVAATFPQPTEVGAENRFSRTSIFADEPKGFVHSNFLISRSSKFSFFFLIEDNWENK